MKTTTYPTPLILSLPKDVGTGFQPARPEIILSFSKGVHPEFILSLSKDEGPIRFSKNTGKSRPKKKTTLKIRPN